MIESINDAETGFVFDIQRFSVHDGPGIRTIVFLKGCPLRCAWCCNPESQQLKPVLMFKEDRCISCGKCVKSCSVGAIHLETSPIVNRELCISCGNCTEICPTSALTLKGKKMTVAEIIEELKKDGITYRRSGGGITLSGGEVLVQSTFTVELLKACRSMGWHTAIETTGFASIKTIEKVIPNVDLVLLDIKAMNDKLHQQYTGVSNEVILRNAKRISELTEMAVRVPVIPEVNAFVDEVRDLCEFVKTLKDVKTIHLLPYHSYGENKYEIMGQDYLFKNMNNLSQTVLKNLEQIVVEAGFTCVIGG